tara:strand:- start:168 stop:608 length:441 start_codon:yes stop_codon:yes gene_type:complete
MTITKALTAIKEMIQNSDVDTFDLLVGMNIYLPTEDDNRDYPCIDITDEGVEEHDILRGVFDPLSVDIKLCTTPNDDTLDGTTEAEHQAIVDQLYCLLANINGIQELGAATGLTVFDIRNPSVANSREDGKNTTTFSQDITCCLDN